MNKITKLTTSTLALIAMISGSCLSLALYNNNTYNTTATIQSIQPTTQVDESRITDSFGHVKLYGSPNSASHFAVVSDPIKGDLLYAWGSNSGWQLGIGGAGGFEIADDTFVPTLTLGLPTNVKITDVLIGFNFSLVVINDTSIWGAGNNVRGQLATGGYSDDAVIFQHVVDFDKGITSITTGWGSAMVISDNKLYVWGWDSRGILGLGNIKDTIVFRPTIVDSENFRGKILLEIKASWYNSIMTVMTADGKTEFYTWGAGWNGQLGHGDENDRYVPTLLDFKFPGRVKKFSISYCTTVVLVDIGDKDVLYGWGNNGSSYLLGLPYSDTYQTTPTLINNTINERIVDVIAGESALTVLTESGLVYTAGENTTGNAGHSTGDYAKVLTAIDGVRVSQIVCGRSYTLAIINDKFYVWGSVYGGEREGSVHSTLPMHKDYFAHPSEFQASAKDISNISTVAAISEMYDTSFNETAFKTYIDISKFPVETVFSMNAAPVGYAQIGKVAMTFTASMYYAQDSRKVLTPATFSGTLDGFKQLPDSKITNKTLPSGFKYNLNNIRSALKKTGSSEVNMNSFTELFDATAFAEGNTFTITNDEVSNGNYTATVNATHAYWDGVILNRPFPISITGLKPRLDSQAIAKTPVLAELDYVLNELRNTLPGKEIKSEIMAKMLDTTEFPDGTKFTFNTFKYDEATTTIEIEFLPSMVYKNGDAVTYNLPQTFKANVRFADPEAPTNLGLIIGLSVTGGVLVLILIGLVLLYYKRNPGVESPWTAITRKLRRGRGGWR